MWETNLKKCFFASEKKMNGSDSDGGMRVGGIRVWPFYTRRERRTSDEDRRWRRGIWTPPTEPANQPHNSSLAFIHKPRREYGRR